MGTAISGAILVTMAAFTVMTLGAGEAVDQLSPLLAVARAVFFEGLAERIDVLLLNVLMIGAIFAPTVKPDVRERWMERGRGLRQQARRLVRRAADELDESMEQ